MNLATIVEDHPDYAPGVLRAADGRVMTYGELRARAAVLRTALSRLGVSPGERVALLAGNDAGFVAAYLAVVGLGAVAVPLNPASPPAELKRGLGVVGAGLVLAGAGVPRHPEVAGLAGVVDLDDLVDVDDTEYPGDPDGDSRHPGRNGEWSPVAGRSDDDLAVLALTSGTAGAARAAMLTHGNLLANLRQVQRHPTWAVRPDDVLLAVIPPFHIFGLNVVLGLSLYAGAKVVMFDRFDPVASLEVVRRYGVTLVPGAPAMFAAWLRLPAAETGALTSVRMAISGGAPLPVEVSAEFEARFGVPLRQGYGLTEASPLVSTSAGSPDPRPGSVGVPLDGVEVRLVDEEGHDALVGDAGEVWVRGPNVFRGYWEDHEATARVLTPDGWLRTGDVAVADDQGELHIVDRVKDVILVSGFNVYPAEVEEVLERHPAVLRAAAVGLPHPRSGEAVQAYVVTSGPRPQPAELIELCARHLARYKCPAVVKFVDELPLGAGGKVLRHSLG